MDSKTQRNLIYLQKLDNSIAEIIDTAAHIAVYKFEPRDEKWSRYGVEGSAFIVRRASTPFYQFIILNKQGPDNFILDLSTVIKIKMVDPYVMIKYATAGAPIILGFWFHGSDERARLMESLSRTSEASKLRGTAVAGTPITLPTKPASSGVKGDITAILAAAAAASNRNTAVATEPSNSIGIVSKSSDHNIGSSVSGEVLVRGRNKGEFLTDREISARAQLLSVIRPPAFMSPSPEKMLEQQLQQRDAQFADFALPAAAASSPVVTSQIETKKKRSKKAVAPVNSAESEVVKAAQLTTSAANVNDPIIRPIGPLTPESPASHDTTLHVAPLSEGKKIAVSQLLKTLQISSSASVGAATAASTGSVGERALVPGGTVQSAASVVARPDFQAPAMPATFASTVTETAGSKPFAPVGIATGSLSLLSPSDFVQLGSTTKSTSMSAVGGTPNSLSSATSTPTGGLGTNPFASTPNWVSSAPTPSSIQWKPSSFLGMGNTPISSATPTPARTIVPTIGAVGVACVTASNNPIQLLSPSDLLQLK